jgi:hypothetical protein
MAVGKTFNEVKSKDLLPVEKVFSMGKGEGEESYSKNSRYQAIVSRTSMSLLDEALDKATFALERGPVVVTDLGSSSGPNAIVSMAAIVDKLRLRVHSDASFQVYFNDLPSNDFNNLFKLLRSDKRADNFFAAGVPGSFFGRLFPPSSVHLVYSSICLHWMSNVPEAVVDVDSPSYNTFNPWITGASTAVSTSYREQSSRDLQNFLVCRAAEMVSGGALFCSFIGRSTADPTAPTYDLFTVFLRDLVEIWSDLLAEGLVTKEQLDTFNIPLYVRSIEELNEDIASCDSLFSVQTVQVQKIEMSAHDVFAASGVKPLASKMRCMMSSLANSLFEAHFGKALSEIVWQRYEVLAEDRLRTDPQYQLVRNSIAFVSLTRK